MVTVLGLALPTLVAWTIAALLGDGEGLADGDREGLKLGDSDGDSAISQFPVGNRVIASIVAHNLRLRIRTKPKSSAL